MFFLTHSDKICRFMEAWGEIDNTEKKNDRYYIEFDKLPCQIFECYDTFKYFLKHINFDLRVYRRRQEDPIHS
jgi:hypothetical protein